MPDNCDPDTWVSLELFARVGGGYKADRLLRGGMDPAQADVLTGARLCAAVNWMEVDQCYEVIQGGGSMEPAQAGSDSGQLARALFAKASIGQMRRLTALPRAILTRATISPARLMALIVVMERKSWDAIPIVPAWIRARSWVEVRCHCVQIRELIAGDQGSAYRQIQTALFGAMERIIPELEQFTDWETLRPETRIDGDLRAKAELIGISTVLPTGPWVEDLLKGLKRLTTDSYCTLQPRDGFCETVLDGHDSQLLLAIGMSTAQTVPDFLAMLNTALREAMQTDLVLTRITTSKAMGGGKGQQVKIIHFPPTSDQAEIAVGINAYALLLRHRERPTVELNLGREGETPV